jgi:signal transduction histidine kinase
MIGRELEDSMRLIRPISLVILIPGTALLLLVIGAAAHAYAGWQGLVWLVIASTALLMYAAWSLRRAVMRLAEQWNLTEPVKAVGSPVAELHALSVAWGAARARMNRMLTAQQEFTANAAHELRTPLAALRLAGESSLRTIDEGEASAREAIGAMLEEADRATKLVNRLLMLARAESGNLAVEARQMELRELVEPVLEWLCPLAEERGQTVVLEAEEKVSAWVDENLLRMALENLVGNAIHYGPPHSAILIRACRFTEGVMALEVLDDGPGIDPDEVERLFERFARGGTDRKGGSGLGLSIARWAVEAFGGRVEYERRIGQGSLFRICCPASKPASQDDEAELASELKPS